MARSSRAGSRRARVGRGQRWSVAEKARYLSDFAASGLRGAAFVRRTGLPQSTFDLWRSEARWRRRVSRRAPRESATTPGFARVEVVGPSASSGITLVVRSGPGVVTEFGGLDSARAVSLLEAALRGSAR